MNWEPIAAVVALLVGQGVNIIVVRAFVRAEVQKLNGIYRRTELCDERHREADRRVTRLEARARV